MALTRDMSEVNGQRPIRTFRTNFTGIYKTRDQIYKLNYRGPNPKLEINWKIKSVILPK